MSASHVDPAEALKIHFDVRSQQSIPVHWGTFQLTHETLLEPPELLRQALQAKTIDQRVFKPVKIGDTLVLD